MKSANREIFKHDLALRIADAEHTHQAVLQSKEPEAVLPAVCNYSYLLINSQIRCLNI